MPLDRMLVKRAFRSAPPALLAALTAGFLWSAICGESGTLANAERRHQIAQAKLQLAHAEETEAAMARDVAGLQGPVIDSDLLEIRARQVLGLVRPNDLVMPYEERRAGGSAPASAALSTEPRRSR